MSQEVNESSHNTNAKPETQEVVQRRFGSYLVGETIGQGSFGKVKLATRIDDNVKVAIKIVSKEHISDISDVERIYRETFILTSLKHQNIIRLYEIMDTHKALMIVTEFAGGGELFDHISKELRLPEDVACDMFQQIISGVEYCHRKKIIHRDLKLENILLNENHVVKIADFGLSNSIKIGQKMGTSCGTPAYTSPEQILYKEYSGAPCDIWALGVILYAMVCGFLPFEAKTIPLLQKKICKGVLKFPAFITSECQDLISCMLKVDPKERITIPNLRNHAWYQMKFTEGVYEKIVEAASLSQEDIAAQMAVCRLSMSEPTNDSPSDATSHSRAPTSDNIEAQSADTAFNDSISKLALEDLDELSPISDIKATTPTSPNRHAISLDLDREYGYGSPSSGRHHRRTLSNDHRRAPSLPRTKGSPIKTPKARHLSADFVGTKHEDDKLKFPPINSPARGQHIRRKSGQTPPRKPALDMGNSPKRLSLTNSNVSSPSRRAKNSN